MNEKILKLIEKDARISNASIAEICGISEAEVREQITEMEKEGIIRGYKGVIDWSRANRDLVSAAIELKVTPRADTGFEEVAARIARYPEVESVSLMSGACDLLVVVRGKSFSEVAKFVSGELAVIDAVTSTATQFIMKRYKEFGVELIDTDDEREIISL